jgi:hypothetical protein
MNEKERLLDQHWNYNDACISNCNQNWNIGKGGK